MAKGRVVGWFSRLRRSELSAEVPRTWDEETIRRTLSTRPQLGPGAPEPDPMRAMYWDMVRQGHPRAATAVARAIAAKEATRK